MKNEETPGKTELAEDRTDLAEDRTLLANERTFSGWARTAMASIGIGIGFNALFKLVEPTWVAKAIATIFILLGIFLTISAERRAASVQRRLDAHNVANIRDQLPYHVTRDLDRSSRVADRHLVAGVIAPPSPHAAAAIVLTTLMFYGFAAGRIKIEIISLLTISAIALGLYSFPLPGQQPTDGLKLAFEGFGHYALITICALMIMGRGLVVTGALEPVARFLTRIWRYNQRLGFLVTLLLAMLLSMMVNDTPVLVLLLPILVTLAERGGMPASRTLIPVNSAVLIGGMATTIGTSTNLLVVSIARDLGMREITVFHFTPIVMIAAAVALPFIWLVMPRLLPDNSKEAGHSSRQFYADLRIRAGSPALGRRAGDVLRRLRQGGAPDFGAERRSRD